MIALARLKDTLARLHAIESDVELAGALCPKDTRLRDAEIALHECIRQIERAAKHPGPEEKWDCSKHGHEDNQAMFYGECKHCGIDL